MSNLTNESTAVRNSINDAKSCLQAARDELDNKARHKAFIYVCGNEKGWKDRLGREVTIKRTNIGREIQQVGVSIPDEDGDAREHVFTIDEFVNKFTR